MAFGQERAAVLDAQAVMFAHLVRAVDVGRRAVGDVVAHLVRAFGALPVQVGAAEGLELAPVLLEEVLFVHERDPAAVSVVGQLEGAAAEIAQLVGPQVFRAQAARVARGEGGDLFQLLVAVCEGFPDGGEGAALLQLAVVVVDEDGLDAVHRVEKLFDDLGEVLRGQGVRAVDDVWKLLIVDRREGFQAGMQDHEPRIVCSDLARHNVWVDVPVDQGLEFVSDLGQDREEIVNGMSHGDRGGRRRHFRIWDESHGSRFD